MTAEKIDKKRRRDMFEVLYRKKMNIEATI